MSNFRHVKFEKVTLATSDEPNISVPHARFSGSDVLLQYQTDRSDGAINEVRFVNALMYRIGDPNDEGFYSDGSDRNNSTIYNTVNFPDLAFGGLHEVFGVDWKRYMSPGNGFVLNPVHKTSEFHSLRHFIYFMKDGTFECVSADFSELGLQPGSVLQSDHSEYTDC